MKKHILLLILFACLIMCKRVRTRTECCEAKQQAKEQRRQLRQERRRMRVLYYGPSVGGYTNFGMGVPFSWNCSYGYYYPNYGPYCPGPTFGFYMNLGSCGRGSCR